MGTNLFMKYAKVIFGTTVYMVNRKEQNIFGGVGVLRKELNFKCLK
jgi:hypothetical protein